MKKLLILIVALLSLTLSVNKAEAKWWIFGQANDEVNINYLYLNKGSYDESGSKLTLYKQNLAEGKIEIAGKASVPQGKIGAVWITKDNKQTWEKANLNTSGTFQYYFTPDADKEYDLYIKIIDTSGKTNIIDDTYKQIIVSDKDFSSAIRTSLSEMIKAYENEETNLFMTYVSPNFTGDESILNSAIRKDFNAFDLIKINYFINNISTSPDGKTFVSISYQRTVVSSKSGNTYSDNGNTELIFTNENGKQKIFSMKNPLIFGLSDAGNVATGTIQSPNNNPIILVDSSGNVDEKPFTQAINIIEDGADISSNTESGSETILVWERFSFVSGSKVGAGGDILFEAPNIIITADTGGQAQKLTGITSLSSVTEVPASGYDWNLNPEQGSVYALTLGNGKYAIMKITSYTVGTSMTFEYKYQPDGSRNF